MFAEAAAMLGGEAFPPSWKVTINFKRLSIATLLPSPPTTLIRRKEDNKQGGTFLHGGDPHRSALSYMTVSRGVERAAPGFIVRKAGKGSIFITQRGLLLASDLFSDVLYLSPLLSVTSSHDDTLVRGKSPSAEENVCENVMAAIIIFFLLCCLGGVNETVSSPLSPSFFLRFRVERGKLPVP